MDPTVLPREQVAHHLAVSTSTLVRFEALGLVRPVCLGGVEGYGPAEIRRLWTIMTFQRDLGINLAGIEVILRLRDRMTATESRLERLASAFRETLEEQLGPEDDG